MALLRRRRADEGQAVVEFALVLSVLVMVLLTVTQFGIVLAHQLDVTDAARAAARRASSYGAPTTYSSAVENAARSAAVSAANSSASVPGMTVTVTATPQWVAGNPVTAKVSAPYSIHIFGFKVSNGTLSSSITMRLERSLGS
jgi:Flp pilus assembly protein TadG